MGFAHQRPVIIGGAGLAATAAWLAISPLVMPRRDDHAYWGRIGKRRKPRKTKAQIKRAKAQKAQRLARRKNR